MADVKRFLLLGALVTGLMAAESRAQVPAEARILGITATTEVVTVHSTYNNLEARRLPKFAPRGRTVAQAVLVVNWQTIRALPGGTLVRFSYRRPDADTVRNLEERYDRALTGRQQTRFAVRLDDPVRDRVAAWRVQLVHQGQVLDEQRSASWR